MAGIILSGIKDLSNTNMKKLKNLKPTQETLIRAMMKEAERVGNAKMKFKVRGKTITYTLITAE